MAEWFYAEGNRQQRGPLTSEELIALYQSSRIALDTLVWRDGMAQWQPLREVADALGLVIAPAPAAAKVDTPTDIGAEPTAAEPTIEPIVEPVAPAPPQIPGYSAATAATAQTLPPSASAAVAPRKGLSGCAIAAIVAGAVLLVLIVVGAILAAIALPAYQEYTQRAKAQQAISSLGPLKLQVTEFVQTHGRCPVNDDEGFLAADSYADGPLSAVRIGRFDNSHCGIEAELSTPGSRALDGKLIWLDYDGEQQHWTCSAEPDDKYLPADCRG